MPVATSLCPCWVLPGWGSPRLIHSWTAAWDSLGEEGKKPAPRDAGCGVGVLGCQGASCQGLESSTWARRQSGSLHVLSAKMGLS